MVAAVTVPDTAVVASFLNLGPARWWQFKDLNSNGKISRWECAELTPDRFQLRARLGNTRVEHVVESKEVELEGVRLPQLTVVESKIDDQVATWIGGLVMPASWKVGDTVSATSKEAANPATGNPVQLTVKLVKHGGLQPPPGTPFPPDRPLEVIELDQRVIDAKLAIKLAESHQVFALGLGICEAKGNNFGSYYALQFQDWSGAH